MAEISRAKVEQDIKELRRCIDILQQDAERLHAKLQAIGEEQRELKTRLLSSEQLLGALS